jgi:hypothetical protein
MTEFIFIDFCINNSNVLSVKTFSQSTPPQVFPYTLVELII